MRIESRIRINSKEILGRGDVPQLEVKFLLFADDEEDSCDIETYIVRGDEVEFINERDMRSLLAVDKGSPIDTALAIAVRETSQRAQQFLQLLRHGGDYKSMPYTIIDEEIPVIDVSSEPITLIGQKEVGHELANQHIGDIVRRSGLGDTPIDLFN